MAVNPKCISIRKASGGVIHKKPVDDMNTQDVPNTTVSSDQKNSIFCKVCDLEYTDIAELKCHIKSVHKRMLFNCPICEYPMFSKSNLKNHYKLNHRKFAK